MKKMQEKKMERFYEASDMDAVIYSRAWWIAQGIPPGQVVTLAERERRAQEWREKQNTCLKHVF